jgi:surface polysaccharide O-acyltransferase-like enzyme
LQNETSLVLASQFKFSIDNFRGLAILFVMLSHISYFRPMGKVGDYGYFVVGDATSWFVFISGYLFYYIERQRYSFRGYIRKKLEFVILPYLIISLPAILAGLYCARHVLLGLSVPAYYIWSLCVGGSVVGPLWFVPMIAVFFLTSPLWHRIARSQWIVVAAVLAITFSLFSSRPIGDMNPFLSFLHFLGFYLLGIVFGKYTGKLEGLTNSWLGLLIIVAGVAGFLVAGYFYDETDAELHGFFDSLGVFNALQLGKLSLLIALFFFFERFVNRKNIVLAYFAQISFGLFFMHGFFVVLFAEMTRGIATVVPAVMLMAELGFVLAGSVMVVFLLKRGLRKGSRYVIGC